VTDDHPLHGILHLLIGISVKLSPVKISGSNGKKRKEKELLLSLLLLNVFYFCSLNETRKCVWFGLVGRVED
jgi:hypothetical protein